MQALFSVSQELSPYSTERAATAIWETQRQMGKTNTAQPAPANHELETAIVVDKAHVHHEGPDGLVRPFKIEQMYGAAAKTEVTPAAIPNSSRWNWSMVQILGVRPEYFRPLLTKFCSISSRSNVSFTNSTIKSVSSPPLQL